MAPTLVPRRPESTSMSILASSSVSCLRKRHPHRGRPIRANGAVLQSEEGSRSFRLCDSSTVKPCRALLPYCPCRRRERTRWVSSADRAASSARLNCARGSMHRGHSASGSQCIGVQCIGVRSQYCCFSYPTPVFGSLNLAAVGCGGSGCGVQSMVCFFGCVLSCDA
jgi:hypothetical protein